MLRLSCHFRPTTRENIWLGKSQQIWGPFYEAHKWAVINSSGHQKYGKSVHEKVISRKEARAEAFMTYKLSEFAL